MKMIKIPNAPYEISQIGLGGMSLNKDKKQSRLIIDAALDHGINLLDTADLYQHGLNEEWIGGAVKSKRKEVVLASKVGNQWRPDGSGWDWNPKKEYILKAVESSLKRLKTDYIDLYQLHGGTLDDNLEEAFGAFELLQAQGKIITYGISSIRPNVVRKVLDIARPATVMMQYSPLDRRPEESVFPLLMQSDSRVFVRGAFAKGLLIDKPAESFLNYSAAEVKAVRDLIADSGIVPEAFLIRFGLAQPATASLIIGASTESQLQKMIIGYVQQDKIPEELLEEIISKFPVNHYSQHR